ncbi:hypothetical protein GOP47_0022920 [Adiantum capillus-veneris]|uniref:Spermatogenesis-associated protein 20-like TRX domain-containing protein n=1 Tax=Adiantum capillus-veneris TaxID=13818 RepID=A0A9D4Z7C0_ADICA|nr:hypothetical protein GOP47_0022920 [Adiantum capillus-veneris]
MATKGDLRLSYGGYGIYGGINGMQYNLAGAFFGAMPRIPGGLSPTFASAFEVKSFCQTKQIQMMFIYYVATLASCQVHLQSVMRYKLNRCHVMEVESFENEDVARLLNDWFVSIKVDREERPDVDKVYMTYVQATQGGGGWPMSVFLTPELMPMVGGTYFPADDKYGRPGFKSILRRVKEVWDTKKDAIRHNGELIVQQLAEATTSSASSAELALDSSQEAVELCAKQLAKGYDAKLGGFGGPPKFPRPVELYVIMRQYRRLHQAGKTAAASKVLEMALHTLRCMAKGGIHDHVGGGFHRYSVDEYWHVPHFEKMLYDQGQLVNAYLDALCITKTPVYANVARDVLDYLKRDMLDPEGGIYSAEDADSLEREGLARKKEGAFYVWTSQEIEDILGKENAEPFMKFYYVKHNGNCDLARLSDPHGEFVGKNVLIERMELEELSAAFKRPVEDCAALLGSCRTDLFDYRSKRPRPHLDDKVIVAWNGLAISAFARASKLLTVEPKGISHHFPVVGTNLTEYLHIAERASSFIKGKLYDDATKRLRRSFRKGPSMAPGFADDYAFLIAGLLDLFEAGGQTKWLAWALELQETQDALFLDKTGGGYYSTPEGDSSILFRMKEDYDGAEPSPNSVSAINLVRLSLLAHGDQSKYFHNTAEHLLAVFESRIKELPVAVPLMCCAADLLGVPSKRQIVIAGQKQSPEFQELLNASHGLYDPYKIVIPIDPSDTEDQEFWHKFNPAVLAMAQNTPTGKATVSHPMPLCKA